MNTDKSSTQDVSRRKFLKTGTIGVGMTSLSLAACGASNASSEAGKSQAGEKTETTSSTSGSQTQNKGKSETSSKASAYDYIVIGGGTAGPVLAARLSENPEVSVLILEAGRENTFEYSEYANGVGKMWGPATNWGFKSAPQSELNNREVNQPRGKVLGGSAAINVGSWSRGTQSNYESWDIPGWDWPTLLSLFKKIENAPDSDAAFRGQDGPMRLEETPAGTEMTEVMRQAAIQAGVGETPDRNAKNPIGFEIWETIFPNGRRWNTEHAYLRPARSRSNLQVETQALVTKINFDGKRANSVSYTQGNETHTIEATKEILLCAGAINSPQILMLSGVGPEDHLREHGIEVVENVPSIGANLSDHMRIDFGALTPKGVGETIFSDASDPKQLEQWRSGHYGPLTVAENTAAAFLKSDESVAHPDIEIMYSINPPYSMRGKDFAGRAGWYFNVGLVQPKSKGSVRLQSSDPKDLAIYDPAYLSDPEDLKTYIKGTRIALSHVKTKALSAYTDMSTLSLSPDATDAELEDHIRKTAESIYHPVGSVKMGKLDDDSAPLDPQCRVKGVTGLRVVDASAIPSLVSGHTMAPTILVAERVAEFMKEG